MAIAFQPDTEIQRRVMAELDLDPQINVTDVGVEVDDGVVTLTGTVETYGHKLAAERAAFRAEGIRAVANDLIVQPDGVGLPTDTCIAREIANAFEWSTAVPEDSIKLRVAEGGVTLEGEVEWEYQRTAADEIARRMEGVRSVRNLITVRHSAESAVILQGRITQALLRAAEQDARAIDVEVVNGHVTLTGTVRSWAERQEAQDAVAKGRGVTQVTNKIQIQPTRT